MTEQNNTGSAGLTGEGPGETPFRHHKGIALALVLLVVVVFARTLTCGFIDLDDDVYVTLNPHVWRGLTAENVAWAWANVEGASWMPLTWMTLQLDGTLTGQTGGSPADFASPGTFRAPMRARWYHLQNVAWHAGATVVLFFLLHRATRRLRASAVIAAIWAVHPLRVESVAWVAERKDVLAMFWGLAAIYGYVRWTEGGTRRRAWLGISCGCFALSLMGKALFVTLPAVLLLLDYWPLRRGPLVRRLVEKAPYAGIAVVMAMVTLYAQAAAEAVKPLGEIGPGLRGTNALLSLVRYMVMQVRCWDLGLFYPFPQENRFAAWQVVAAAVIVGVVTLWSAYYRKARPWVWVGWLWYVVTLLPVVGIVQIGEQTHADRYSYLPAIGLCLMVCMSLPEATWRWGMVRAGATGVTVVLAGLTIRQIGYWKDGVTLFERSVAVTFRDNYYLRYNLALSYLREDRFDEAEHVLKESTVIKPGFINGHSGLGFLYLQRERWEEASVELRRALELMPDNPEFHNMRGYALIKLGRAGEAKKEFEAALKAAPQDKQTQMNLRITEELLQNAATSPASRHAE